MSEQTVEFLISALTDLLEVAVWGGLAAGVLLVWRPQDARRITLIQAAVTAVVAAAIVAGSWTREWSGIVEFGSWPALPSMSTGGVRIAHGIDVQSGVLLFAVTVLFLLTAVRSQTGRQSGDSGATPGSDIVRFLFLQVAVQFVLMADPVLRIACLPLMSLCCLCGRVCDRRLTTAEIVAARRTFLFRTAGDGLMLLGIGLLVVTATGSGAGDGTAAAGTMLWVGAVIRAASFPFFSDDESPYDDTLERVLAGPAGIVVLLTLWPVLAYVDVVAQGQRVGGLVLALLAGGVAAARPGGGRTATAIALTGLMLAGLGSGSAEGRQGAVLLFASTTVILPLVRAPTSQGSQKNPGMLMDQSPFIGVLLLGSGFCGSAMIFASLMSRSSTGIGGGIFVAAHLLVIIALVREKREKRGQDSFRSEDRSIPSANNEKSPDPFSPVIALMSLVGLTALIVGTHWNPPALPAHSLGRPFAAGEPLPAHAFEYAVVAILGAIGVTAGWILRSGLRKASSPGHPVKAPGTFRRLLRAGFYLEEAFLLAVVLPLRGGAQLCRFFEWFIIERLWDLPRRFPEWLGRLGEPLQGGSVRLSVAAILLATAALLGVIVGLSS